MRVRVTTHLDYEEANIWRMARDVPVVQESLLPKTGAVCERSDGRPIAMAWIYLSNSKLAYLAWPVTKPGLSPRLAKEALTLVFTELLALAASLGFTSIIATAESRGLVKLLKQCGMTQTGNAHAILSMGVG